MNPIYTSASGKPIRLGDVLECFTDGDRGMVVNIVREGDMGMPGLTQVGDIHIKTSPGCTRVSNQYTKWRHVPHDEQTYAQRYAAWFFDPRALDYNCLADDETKSVHEKKAISGIMALLPESTVDWETGPWPDSIEQALTFLVDHLEGRR